MKIKTVSGIMLTLLLTSMLTLAFNIQTVKAENSFWKEVATFSGSGCIQENTTSFVVWEEEWRIKYSYEPIANTSGEFNLTVYRGEGDPSVGLTYWVWDGIYKQVEEAGEGVKSLYNYVDNYAEPHRYILRLEMVNVSYSLVVEEFNTFVEVTRFSGGGYVSGNTENFTINHVRWRIRSWFEPMVSDGRYSWDLYCYKGGYLFRANGVTMNYVDKAGEFMSVCFLSSDEVPRTFFLELEMENLYYTIVIEQDITSIPEFPTWTPILLILIVLTVVIAIYKGRLLKTPIP